MTFEEAMKAMRDGKKVRRKAWPNKHILYLGNCYGLLEIRISTENSDNSSLWTPSVFELAADDWEIVEEQERSALSFEEFPELTIGGGWKKCIVKYRDARRLAYAMIIGDINMERNITQDEYVTNIELHISGGKLES